jgi:chaperonin GroES
MSKYIEPKNGYIVLKPIEEQEVLAGNIILPDLGKERPEVATVKSISVGYNFYTGTSLPSTLKEGDVVLVPKMGAVKVSFDGSDYYICKESDVYGIVKEADEIKVNIEAIKEILAETEPLKEK